MKQASAAADYSYLDSQAYSGTDLGCTYTKSKTTFKVWAPTASKVQLRRYTTGSDSEDGAKIIATEDMSKGSNGVWSISISGDIKNQYYTYLVTQNNEVNETVDIYAKAAGVNGNRGMVVDLDSTDPAGWDNDTFVKCEDQTDAIVWESHVRDFSIDSNSGMKNKGKYLAYTERGTTLNNAGKTKTGLDYLVDLGITHVQLTPVYDYGSVDETKLNQDQYNWGYDPKNYNVPEGSYSTNPYDGNVRIKEFKQMVQSLHSENIGVIMDVVYNHTYATEESWFNKTVYGYYYRHNNKGFANGSGCGNETASERAMYQKYMIESLKYWMTEYHVDGFRFDLMGIHDVDTMNLIKQELQKINPDVVIYGEPWSAETVATSKATAVQGNMKLVDAEVGAFNDKIRDAIKGSCFNANATGFIQGAYGYEESIKQGIQANTSVASANTWSKQPSQTVTYVSAHDNYTLYDKLVKSVKGGSSYDKYYDDLVAMNKLAGGIVLTSQGVAFMQAGEEFARTKYGDENSYESPTSVNQLSWNRVEKFSSIVNYYKGLIAIRKAYSPFTDSTNTSNKTIYFSWGSNCPSGVVAYTMQNKLNPDNEWNYVAVIHNSNASSKQVTLQAASTLPGKWVVIADGQNAGVEKLSEVNSNTITVPARSTMVLVDSTSFYAHPVKAKGTVLVKYINSKTGEEIAPSTTMQGTIGTRYSTNPIELDDYVLSETPSNATGTYVEGTTTVTYKYIPDTTPKGTVTVKYVDKSTKKEISESTVLTGKQGKTYETTAKTIKGYTLDETSLPSNASGVYTANNQTVTYYYNEKVTKNLTVHYYNANNYSKVYLYAYDKTTGSGTIKYTGSWPGTMMTDEGSGWWSYEVDDYESGYVIFNNGSNSQEPAANKDGYLAEGEVWIKNGEINDHNPDVQYGKVIVSYIDKDTNESIASSTTLTGVVGKSYQTSAKSISGYKLTVTPLNASGVYTASNITVKYLYEKESTDPLKITTTKATSTDNYVGTKVTLSTEATGGEGTIKYRFVAQLNGKNAFVKDYTTSKSVTWTPSKAGTYTIYYKVKDEAGTIVCKSSKLTIKEKTVSKLQISSINATSKDNYVGSAVTLSTEATGGEGTVKYRFVAQLNGKNAFVKNYTTNKSVTWTPSKAGTYTIYYKVKDEAGTVVCKSSKLTIKEKSVSELKITDYSANTTSMGTIKAVRFVMSATGEGDLQYRFVVQKNGKNVFVQNYSNNNYSLWLPEESGTYKVYFKVKDSTGKIVSKSKTITIK